MLKFYEIAIFLIFTTTSLAAHLPSNFETCSTLDSECLKMKTEDAISKLATAGNEELGIPRLDPLLAGGFTIKQRPGSISLSQNYTNIVYMGLSDIKIPTFRINLDNCSIYFDAFVPHNHVTSHYALKGNLLTLPLDSEGELEVFQNNTRFSNNLTCEKYEENGSEYVRFVNFTMNISWGDTVFHMGDLIKGNHQLSEEIENKINEDPKALLEAFTPELEVYMGERFRNLANKLFTKVPLKEIFKY